MTPNANNFVTMNCKVLSLEVETARRQRMQCQVVGEDVKATVNFDGDCSLKAKAFLRAGSIVCLYGYLDNEGERLVVNATDFTLIPIDEETKTMIPEKTIVPKDDEGLAKKIEAMSPERI
jgi:hypothetical protein